MTPEWQGAPPYFRRIRPGAGFKTGDFVKEKQGGGTVERRQRGTPSHFWGSSPDKVHIYSQTELRCTQEAQPRIYTIP